MPLYHVIMGDGLAERRTSKTTPEPVWRMDGLAVNLGAEPAGALETVGER